MPILVDGELVLYGFVGDDWWGDGFTASQVIDALAEVGRDSDITVRINSGGGYTDDGIAIFNALTAHRGAVSVVVDAMAASAASIIAMAGDTITMRAGSLMMIHDPSGVTFGTAADHEKSREQLDKLGAVMADIYAEQTGDDPDTIRDDMKATLWMTGPEAVERGFATATEAQRSAAVAAFDYRVYANAPKRLVALAEKERWSFDAEAKHHTVPAVQPKPHAKEKPTMAQKPAAAGNNPPATPAQPTAAAPAPAAPVAPEPNTTADVKARIKAITEAPEAQSHATLARHLAFDTDMPADEAIATLKAAASDGGDDGDGKPDPQAYQARRSAAADLAQPAPASQPGKTKAIDTGAIYGKRRAAKE